MAREWKVLLLTICRSLGPSIPWLVYQNSQGAFRTLARTGSCQQIALYLRLRRN